MAPWFLSSLIPFNYEYYNNLILPVFTPPNWFYEVAWTIVYSLIALSVLLIIKDYKYNKEEIPMSYKITLLINYLLNQSFTVTFFILENPFLGLLSSLGTFISSLYLYEESYKINETSSKLLIPYILLSLFATVLSLSIFVLNTL